MAHRYKSILCVCLILAAVAAAAGLCLWHFWPRHRVELLFRVDASDEQGPVVEEVRAVIQRRLRALGASWASARIQGKGHIAVRLTRGEPSYIRQIRATIEDPGRLEFRLVADRRSPPFEEWERSGRTQPPAGYSVYEIFGIGVDPEFARREAILVSDRAGMTGSHITHSYVSTAGSGSHLRPAIVVSFSPLGAHGFSTFTGANTGKRLGIVFNTRRAPDGTIVAKGRCYSAPMIKGAVFGDAEIRGDFDLAKARSLAAVLAGGSLPVPVALVKQTNLGSR